jgi:Sec-independent protein translocase protein TatA
MSFLGMGTLEILVIVFIAFIFLGPERMVDAARFLGKAVREVRRMAAELPEVSLEEDEVQQSQKPAAQHFEGPGEEPTRPSDSPTDGPSADGPVSFQPASGNGSQEKLKFKKEQP